METVNNTQHEFELEDLRQQMAAIKEKVDQQGHLNEELVKEAIQSKMKGVHRTSFKLSLVALLCIPCYIAMRYTYNFSWPFIIVTILMLIGFVLADYLINRLDVSHMGDDLVVTARKLTQMKKNRSMSQKIGIAMTIPWLAWFCYESFMHRAITYGTADTWDASRNYLWHSRHLGLCHHLFCRWHHRFLDWHEDIPQDATRQR